MAAKVIYGDEARLLPWAKARIGISFRRDAYSMGLERDGELVAVVVFDNFSDGDCNMHIASDGSRRWMNKDLLLAAFAYPFAQLGFRRVTGLVASSNEGSLRLAEHVGFVREGYHPRALPNDDLISLGLLKEHCRFVDRGAT